MLLGILSLLGTGFIFASNRDKPKDFGPHFEQEGLSEECIIGKIKTIDTAKEKIIVTNCDGTDIDLAVSAFTKIINFEKLEKKLDNFDNMERSGERPEKGKGKHKKLNKAHLEPKAFSLALADLKEGASVKVYLYKSDTKLKNAAKIIVR